MECQNGLFQKAQSQEDKRILENLQAFEQNNLLTDNHSLPCIGEISIAMLCEEDTVLDLLASLDASKSCGPDSISAQMLKRTAASIAPSVPLLFNQSLKQGQIGKSLTLFPSLKSLQQSLRTTIDLFHCSVSSVRF